MAQYHNQSVITIRKPNTVDNEWIAYDDVCAAARVLNGSAIKLYIYLCSYQDQETVDLSPKAIEETVGIGRGSTRNALAELIQYGYLTREKEGVYTFYAGGKN